MIKKCGIATVIGCSLILSHMAGAKDEYSNDKNLRKDVTPTEYFEQRWDEETRQRYYFTPQGSKIIPYDWAMALETEDGKPFFSSVNLRFYGYIPQGKSKMNPDGLPVGFTKDTKTGGFISDSHRLSQGIKNKDGYVSKDQVPFFQRSSQLGINCAACHTSELSYKGTKLRVEGGTSYSDFQLFVKHMDDAIKKISIKNRKGEKNYENFLRFTKRLFKRTKKDVTSVDVVNQLRKQLTEFYQHRKQWDETNGMKYAGIKYGPGRNDAFGVIFNQALATMINEPRNKRPPNAPVKYPMIWDASDHDVVQWIGIARNSEEAGGPIARNIGQVLGVFGHADVYNPVQSKIYPTKGYCSSAKRTELNDFEAWIKKLRSPSWPAKKFGFDVAKAKRGQAIYKQQCMGCHELPERANEAGKMFADEHIAALGLKKDHGLELFKAVSQGGRKANEKMISIASIDTDPLTATNAYMREAYTGVLAGRKTKVLAGREMEDVEAGVTVLRHVVGGAIIASSSHKACMNVDRNLPAQAKLAKKFGSGVWDAIFGNKPPSELATQAARLAKYEKEFHKYKARPLNGIWAAPPYLHNGSVASLMDLLTPEERKSFSFGCNEFDPVNVGIDCSDVNESNRISKQDFKFKTGKDAKAMPGNGSQGHIFGARLSKNEKLDLIEYLKAL